MKNIINKEARAFSGANFKKRNLGGFTIIEILIVLAIAGLILTIIFIAVPQLQRNTRDSKRQNMATRLSTELQSYASNNQGRFPFATTGATYPGTNCATVSATAFSCYTWYNRYISGGKVDITDPKSGTNAEVYSTTATGPATGQWASSRVLIGAGKLCNGEEFSNGSNAGATSKDFAILVGLERSDTWYCVSNG